MARNLLRFSCGIALSMLLSSCGAGRYAGLDLRPGIVAEDVRRLALQARGGDKHAQLALGDLFVAGRGIPRDLAKARSLYASAAQESGGTLWVYSPPVGKQKAGSVIPITRPMIPGLPAAVARLEALDAIVVTERKRTQD